MGSNEKCPKCGGIMTNKCDIRSLIATGYGAEWKECENPRCEFIIKINRETKEEMK